MREHLWEQSVPGGVFFIIAYRYRRIGFTYLKNMINVEVFSMPFSNFESKNVTTTKKIIQL